MNIYLLRQELDCGKTIFDIALRVAFYARVSTDRDEQRGSLGNQISYFNDYIGGIASWNFAGGYIDEGVSGTSTAKRENFLKMIADAKLGKFDLIVTKEISRFSRSTLDSIKYTQELLECGVGVYFKSDNINTFYSDSELRLTIMSSIAQDEVRRLSERVKFGMKRAYEHGRVLGQSNIYGYDKQGGKLTINESQARFVRELFELYAQNKYGYKKVAQIMNERGFRNTLGGAIDPGTINGILTNPKYMGYYHGRKTESSDYKNKKNIKLPEQMQLKYKDENIPQIVSEELFSIVNNIIADRAKKYKTKSKGTQHRFAYSAKIKCEEHNNFYYRVMRNDRKVPQEIWCCKNYLAGGRANCKSPNIYTRDLDKLLACIGSGLLTAENTEQSMNALLDRYAGIGCDKQDVSEKISALTKECNKLDCKAERLLELYCNGEINKDTFAAQNSRIEEQRTQINRNIAQFNAEQNKNTSIEEIIGNARQFLSNISTADLAPLELAKEMLTSITVLADSTKKCIKLRVKMCYSNAVYEANDDTIILVWQTEVSPIVGTERQSEELINYLLAEFENDPQSIWATDLFGKSLHDVVKEGLSNKIAGVPEDARVKLQTTLTRMVNEGDGGMLCVLL